jgi:hypothetical protein
MDAYVDTPWREQAQWWGDARVQAWNTFHLDGDTRLFRRGIQQIATQTTEEGITYGHAPTIAHTCILPDFTLIWMLTLWDHYWQTGSLEAFQAHQDEVKKALAYFKQETDPKTGLLRYDPRFWLFLDWTGLQKNGCSSVFSLWLHYVLERLEIMYRADRNTKAASECKRWATTLRKNLRPLINPQGLMRDGYLPNGKINPETSVHAQTLAIMNELAPKHRNTMLEKRLLPCVQGTLNSKIQPSAYWITYVYTVLAEAGYGQDVVADIRKRWTPMVAHGTTWENFDPRKAHESHSHAWSAHPLFHLMQTLGGIRQTAPGWKEITYSPDFIGDHSKVTIPTPLGPVKSFWKRTGTTVSGRLHLPKGMRAQTHIPGEKNRMTSDRYSFATTVK